MAQCKHDRCTSSSTTDGYCRYHYIASRAAKLAGKDEKGKKVRVDADGLTNLERMIEGELVEDELESLDGVRDHLRSTKKVD